MMVGLLSKLAVKLRRAGARAHQIGIVALALAMLWPGAVLADTTIANDARLGGDAQRTRFVADLSREVKFRVFTLENPYRVIVDMPDVRFQMPAGLGNTGRGLVSAYRYGLIAPGKSRIVIDVKAAVRIDKAFVLKAKDGQPARLVVDLVKTDVGAFRKEMRRARASGEGRQASKPPPAKPPVLRKRAKSGGKPLIVIDPGHGGVDPGAVSRGGLREKDVVFSFSKALEAQLKKTGRYRTLMTRRIDVYVPLRERVEIARREGASLFISVHADSVPGRLSTKASGATVYTLSERASDKEAKALAAKENRADIIAGVDLPPKSDEVTNILIDLAQRETKNLSITFADTLVDSMKGATPVRKKARRFAGFRVLKAPDVPSVLVELGYMSNPSDEKRLKSKRWQRKVAVSTTRAVDNYFAKRVARMPY